MKQFSELSFSTCRVTLSVRNNCVQFSHGDVGIVCNTVESYDSEVFVVCELPVFDTEDSFFDYPCKSENLGFCLRATNLRQKLVLLKLRMLLRNVCVYRMTVYV